MKQTFTKLKGEIDSSTIIPKLMRYSEAELREKFIPVDTLKKEFNFTP